MFIILTATTARSIFAFVISIISSLILDASFLAFISFASFVSFSLSHFSLNLDLISNLVPDTVNTITIGQSFENAVTTDHYVVEIVLDFKTLNIWVAHYNVGVAAVARTLGFNISEGLRHREPSWEYSQWTLDVQIFVAWVRGCFRKCLSSIYLSSGGLDPNLFEFVIRFVISSEHADFGAGIY